jgi:translation initiation factor 5A
MTSLDFNFAEPIASYNDDTDADRAYTTPADIGSIQKSNYVVLSNRPVKVVEVLHSSPGKHGHAKVHLVGIDIFTGRRYECVQPCGQMIRVPNTKKTDYLLIDIDNENYLSLLNEDTCQVRKDLQLRIDTDKVHQRLLDKFHDDTSQIKVTVLKALGEEHIVTFKTLD